MREMKNNGGKKWWAFWRKAPAEEQEKRGAEDGQVLGELSGAETGVTQDAAEKAVEDPTAEKPGEDSTEEKPGGTSEETAEKEASAKVTENTGEDSTAGKLEESSGETAERETPAEAEENTAENTTVEKPGESSEGTAEGEASVGTAERETPAEAEENTAKDSTEEKTGGSSEEELEGTTEGEASEGTAEKETPAEAEENTAENTTVEKPEESSEEEPEGIGEEEAPVGAAGREISTETEEKTAEDSTAENPEEEGENPAGENPTGEVKEEGSYGEQTEIRSEEPGEEKSAEKNSEVNSDIAKETPEEASETAAPLEEGEVSTPVKEGEAEKSAPETEQKEDSGESQTADLIRDNGNGLDHDLSAEEREEEEREKAEQAAYEARRKIRMARLERRKRKRKMQRIACTVVLLLLAFTAAGAAAIHFGYIKLETVQSVIATAETALNTVKEKITSINIGGKNTGDADPNVYNVLISENTGEVNLNPAGSTGPGETSEPGTNGEDDSQVYQPDKEDLELLEQAKHLAAQYSYTDAILLLRNSRNFSKNEDMKKAVREYRRLRKSCVSWPLEEVTHIFYHTLIKDTTKAFDGDYSSGNYNQVMTTIDEFNKITQSMYEKGYVMVSLYDLATADENGHMTRGKIFLPPGKIPFVLSQDDVSYYHYMEGDGFASRLIVDEEGKIRNEYVEDDGSISVGDYDVVPLIDRFVEQHPDFSYHGAKGIVALTGYNGILGYRTDISYETRPDDLDSDKVRWLDEHPDFSLEEERAGAKKVADAMKKEGWMFASHTWGHKNVGEASLERLMTDTENFKENVDPLIGGTDIIIFAFGTDLTTGTEYSGEKFEYFKSAGYNYFCNVDSSKYYVIIRDNYLRMGRRNLDGYRMYYNPDLLDDLFDASEVLDPGRPLPVPEMG